MYTGKLGAGYIPRGCYGIPKRIPFKEVLPLKLRNIVSNKESKSTSAVCVQEMTVLFACLKKNDFKDSGCTKEISAFQKCYSGYQEQMNSKREQQSKGTLVPGERRLSYRQALTLLRKVCGK